MSDTAPTKPDPPSFATHQEEAAFWADHSSEDYRWELTDVEIADPVMLSVRIDAATMERLRAAAGRHGDTVSGLVRSWVIERLTADDAHRGDDPMAQIKWTLTQRLHTAVVNALAGSLEEIASVSASRPPDPAIEPTAPKRTA